MTTARAGDAPELLAIGETMAMVAPVAAVSVAEADLFRIDAGGAESNVAAHVAALGHSAAWFSSLGDDVLGRRVVGQLATRGVGVGQVVFDQRHPTGLYVKSPGRGVTYYRSGSAAAHLDRAAAERPTMAGVRIVHVSGITAALSRSAAAFLSRIIERAGEHGVRISFDVNYRPALWSVDEAKDPLAALVRRADIVFVGRDEAEAVWGTPAAEDVRAHFPSVSELVVKDADVGATVFHRRESFFRPSPRVEVVDAVGAGDAFAGGYLSAVLAGVSFAGRLRAGHARAALTLQTTGDSIDERVNA